jgi:iron complex transport system substrate-binding protein
MFAIGAGDQLVAVDEFSDYPAEAQQLPNDLSAFDNNVEAIAAYEPDLVLIGGDFNGLGAQLDELGIGWWDGPAALTIDDTYRQIEELGAATGHESEAEALIASMQTEIDDIVASTPVPAEPLTFFHEIDETLFSVDSTTFIGELYALLGLENIADRAEGNSGGYPQLSAEFIVSADPDFIFLADTKCCGQSLETVAARPGWADLTAVQSGNVVGLDDDIASRWGPRVVDFLESVSAAVTDAS